MAKKETLPYELVPNLDKLYKTTCEYVKNHQGKKGYIDTQAKDCDSIYGMVYEEENYRGVEVDIKGVRYNEEINELEVVYEYIFYPTFIEYTEESFADEEKWIPIRYNDIIYYVYTLLQIAESIHQYVVDDEED